jgi:farnesyl-diphosphate farnesyltransferase
VKPPKEPDDPDDAAEPIEVLVHAHGLIETLRHPAEIWAALRYTIEQRTSGSGGSIATLFNNSEDAIFCDDMLQKTSRSFAAVIQQLPPELRPAICVFYLLLRALDTVEDDMSAQLAPKLKLLQSFHEQMQDPALTIAGYGMNDNERQLLEGLPSLLRVFGLLPADQRMVITGITQRMGAGMACFAEMDCSNGTRSLVEYELYCTTAAGIVGEGLSALFASSGLEQPALAAEVELSKTMGNFLQKTNIIRDFLEDFVDGRTWWPEEIWLQYVPHLGDLLPQPQPEGGGGGAVSVACLNHMITDALELVPGCLRYLDMLQEPAVARFCAIPQLMAIATQAKLYNNPSVFTGIVKIRPGLAAQLILSTGGGQAQYDDEAVRAWFLYHSDHQAWTCIPCRSISLQVCPEFTIHFCCW